MTLPVRRAARRRAPGIRRASPRLSARRIAAAVVAVGALAAIYGAAASPAFQLRRLDVEGARYTGDDAVSSALGLGATPHPNVFALDTAALQRAVLSLPAVTSADLRVALPDTLVVHVQERQPVLVWAIAGKRWLVDVDGVVMGEASAGDPAEAALPVFVDNRSGRTPLQPGATVDALDLAVARRLGAVTPAMAGSSASALSWTVTDADGFAATPVGNAWRAIFGIYTPTLRPPELIPSQVQCLASLLRQVGEKKVSTVYLFPEGDQCGTYAAKP